MAATRTRYQCRGCYSGACRIRGIMLGDSVMTAKTKLTRLQAYRRAREPASPISFIHPLTGLVYTVLTMAQVEVLRAVKRKGKMRNKLNTTLASADPDTLMRLNKHQSVVTATRQFR